MAAVVLLAIAYIVYRILDLMARRKFAQSYHSVSSYEFCQ